MKIFGKFILAGLSLAVFASETTFGATILVSDNFTASNVTNGFLLGAGINSDINPPTNTRLTGTVAADLRYIRKGSKNESAYSISGGKANITKGAQSGRFTISADGTNPLDFAPALGVASASPANPVVYDVNIAMNNKVIITNSSVGRMTLGFGTTEGGGGSWNFGIQIVPALSGAVTNYNIIKRIRIAASGLTNELNQTMTNAVTAGTEASLLMRITDAGTETDTNFHSRVQVSLDGGTNWFYDTQSDTNLVNGWRFDAETRFVSFDHAPNDGADTYDNFSIVLLDGSPNAGMLTIANGGGGNANISLLGNPGQTYIIERSQNLTNWMGIFTNTADGGGAIQFNEVPPTNPAFYRSRLP